MEAIAEAAALAGDAAYPVKSDDTTLAPDGRATPVAAGVSRINSQLVIAELARVLGLLRCEKRCAAECEIHRRLKGQKIRCPATEWFFANRDESGGLMSTFASSAP